MAQTLAEYRANPPTHIVELCGCGCGKPLEKNDPGGYSYMVVDSKKVLVNNDCYWDSFSDDFDEVCGGCVGGLGIHGPKNKCPLD